MIGGARGGDRHCGLVAARGECSRVEGDGNDIRLTGARVRFGAYGDPRRVVRHGVLENAPPELRTVNASLATVPPWGVRGPKLDFESEISGARSPAVAGLVAKIAGPTCGPSGPPEWMLYFIVRPSPWT